MKTNRPFKLWAGAGLVTMLLGALLALAPGASATHGTETKVSICHRTRSVANPYVMQSVDASAVDGSISHGQDHYTHAGPLFDFTSVDLDVTYPKPRNGDQWGDIIPPVPLVGGGQTAGLNWSVAGQEIWNNDCAGPDDDDGPVVIVEKQVPDVSAADSFLFSVNGSTPATAIDDGDSEEFEVAVGTVTVAEDLTSPAGYTLDDVTCTTADDVDLEVVPVAGAVSFTIASDEVVTCVFTNVPTETASVSIVKTNDANGDGTYGDSESTTAGADVPFRLVITNTGDSDVTVASLADSWGQTPVLDLLSVPAGLTCTIPGEPDPTSFPFADGTTLEPDVVVTCDFTVNGYAPSAPGTRTNTVTLDTDETEPVSDTSVVTTPFVDSSTYSVVVDKLNDANRSGRFSDDESAAAAGDDVEFQITIRNTGTGSLVLQALTDVFGDVTVNLLDASSGLRCPGTGNALAVGTVLPGGSTRVCTFELEGYAPPAGQEIENTVTVDTDRADATDTSRVDTLEVEVLPEPPVTPPGPPVETPPAVTPPVVTPPVVPPAAQTPQVLGDVAARPQNLPRTGDETKGLAGAGVLLVALGAAMLLGSKRQLARR